MRYFYWMILAFEFATLITRLPDQMFLWFENIEIIGSIYVLIILWTMMVSILLPGKDLEFKRQHRINLTTGMLLALCVGIYSIFSNSLFKNIGPGLKMLILILMVYFTIVLLNSIIDIFMLRKPNSEYINQTNEKIELITKMILNNINEQITVLNTVSPEQMNQYISLCEITADEDINEKQLILINNNNNLERKILFDMLFTQGGKDFENEFARINKRNSRYMIHNHSIDRLLKCIYDEFNKID